MAGSWPAWTPAGAAPGRGALDGAPPPAPGTRGVARGGPDSLKWRSASTHPTRETPVMNTGAFLAKSAVHHPGRPALVRGGRDRRHLRAVRRFVRAARPRTRRGPRPPAGRSVRDRDVQRPRVHDRALRVLVRERVRDPHEREASPARVRVHPRELGRARLLRERSPGRDAGRTGRRGRLSRTPGPDGRRGGVERAARGRSAPAPGLRPRRPRVALLHERHHRPAEGRDPHPPQPRLADHELLLRRGRHRRAGLHHPFRPDVARLRAATHSPTSREGRPRSSPRAAGSIRRRSSTSSTPTRGRASSSPRR